MTDDDFINTTRNAALMNKNRGLSGDQFLPLADVLRLCALAASARVVERQAQIAAHRACVGTEHDPANGKLHGCCVVCGIPWPCAYAGVPSEGRSPTVSVLINDSPNAVVSERSEAQERDDPDGPDGDIVRAFRGWFGGDDRPDLSETAPEESAECGFAAGARWARRVGSAPGGRKQVNYQPVRKAIGLMEDAQRELAGGPANYYVRELIGAHDFLMRRFSPFQVGDRVTLVTALDPEKVGDWKRSLHYLKPGEAATVVEAWAGSEGFRYYLEFDNESWLDREGIAQPISRKSLYNFGVGNLVHLHPKVLDK